MQESTVTWKTPRFLLVLSLDDDIHRRMTFFPILCVFIPLSQTFFRVWYWDWQPWSQKSSRGFGCLLRGSQGGLDTPTNGPFFSAPSSALALLHILGTPAFHWNRVSSAGTFCCQLHVWGCESDPVIKTPSKLVYAFPFYAFIHFHRSKEKLLPVAESSFQQNLFSKKKVFWLVGWGFFPLKRRPFQNNFLHPAKHGKRKYTLQLHLVGTFRNNFNSHFLLNVSPFVCIKCNCLAVEG